MDIKDKFLTYISTERRLAQLTVKAYSETIRMFEEYLNALSDPRDLISADRDNIREWLSDLMEQKKSSAYVNRQLAALRTFYKFCYAKGFTSYDPAHCITGPKKEKRLPQFIKEKEIDHLVEILSNKEASYKDSLSRTIILLLYHTGLRAAELISLDDSMIDFTNQELKVTGKRNKQRIIPFGKELHDTLKYYIDTRNREIPNREDALFVNKNGGRLTYYHVRKIVKENISLVSSIKKNSPHVLRHTFATTMLNHNANLESIKKLLGHQNLNTTEIYTHTTFEQLKRTYNDAHPRNG